MTDFELEEELKYLKRKALSGIEQGEVPTVLDGIIKIIDELIKRSKFYF